MNPTPDSIPTRRSLLSRIKNPEDHRSWRDFHDTYHELIRSIALRAGLSATDADDVVQDTLLTVSRTIQNFNTDPGRGSFKGWLYHVTRSRVADHFRRQARAPMLLADAAPEGPATSTATAQPENRLPDTAPPPDEHLDRAWEEAWHRNLLNNALEALKRQVKAHHFQMFFLYVIQERPVTEVARALGTNVALVYLVRHRLLPKYRQALRDAEARTATPRVPPYPADL
jgi:RNA polymerase sigma-70 factor (ECF subfamily)